MIDHDYRTRLADDIENFLDGKIDNWTLDDTICHKTEDILCSELRNQVWFFYDDTKRYRNVGKRKRRPEAEAILRRWVALLRSQMEWRDIASDPELPPSALWGRVWDLFKAPRTKFGSNHYWPLANTEAWDRLFS